jgi:hypothetical protein
MPTVKVPNAVNGPDVPPSDLNVHFDYPLDSTPLSNQQQPDVQRHPPSRGAGIKLVYNRFPTSVPYHSIKPKASFIFTSSVYQLQQRRSQQKAKACTGMQVAMTAVHGNVDSRFRIVSICLIFLRKCTN